MKRDCMNNIDFYCYEHGRKRKSHRNLYGMRSKSLEAVKAKSDVPVAVDPRMVMADEMKALDMSDKTES